MHFSFIFLKLSRAGHSKWKTDLVHRVHEIGFWLKRKTERKSSFISVVHVTESPNFCIFVDLKKTRILLTFAELVNLNNKSFLKDIYDWVLSLVDITWITQILFLSFCAKKIENVQNERELQIDGILQRCSIIIWLYGFLFIFIAGRRQITSFFKV